MKDKNDVQHLSTAVKSCIIINVLHATNLVTFTIWKGDFDIRW